MSDGTNLYNIGSDDFQMFHPQIMNAHFQEDFKETFLNLFMLVTLSSLAQISVYFHWLWLCVDVSVIPKNLEHKS